MSKNDELELLEELYTLERDRLRDEAREDILAFTRYTKEDYIVNWHHQILCDKLNKFADGEIKRMMVFMPPQHGKELSINQLVATKKGIKYHGALIPGDYVFHPSGKPIKVISNIPQPEPVSIEVEFSNGEKIKCHPNHEWTVIKNRQKNLTVETKYFLNNKLWNGDKGKRGSRYIYQLPFNECLELDKKELLIDPYSLGAWLGDGGKGGAIIHAASDENEVLNYFDYKYKRSASNIHKKTGVRRYSYTKSVFHIGLKNENLINYKHIPEHYIFSSKEQRLQLLAGLIDTDGSLHSSSGQYRFINTNKRLINDVCLLLSTLGYTHSLTSAEPRKEPNSSGIQDRQVCYQIGFTPYDIIPCKIPRKQSNKTPKKRKLSIVGVRLLQKNEQEKGNCIQVDSPDGLYLVGCKMIPTHNSELTSRRLPAYMLGQNPNLRIALCAYNATFASKFNRQVQRIMCEPSYTEVFPDTRLNAKNVATDSKGAYLRNSEQFEVVGKNGSFISVGVGGGITGNPVDIALIDDPIKGAEEAGSQTYREKVWEWYTTELETRLNNNSQILITLTRWNIDDIAGRIIENSKLPNSRKWEIVVFPRIKIDNSNPDDPRKIGDVLWPEVHSMQSAMEAKQRNPVKFEALQQQDPKVMEAGSEFYKSFDVHTHVAKIDYDPSMPLHISLDENVNPYITGNLFQIKGKEIYQVDEMCLSHPHNTVKGLALEFKKRYQNHNTGLFVYGDATSLKADTKLEKGQNFFTLFCSYVKDYRPSMRVPRSNPSVAMRGNWINECFENDSIKIRINDKCFHSVEDLQFTKEDADGTKLKKKVKDVRTGISYEKYGHCFVSGTKVLTINGDKNIEDVCIGDKVLTRKGYKTVIKSGLTRKNAVVKTYKLGGNEITCTPDHKIFTFNNGFKSAASLTGSNTFCIFDAKLNAWKEKQLSIMELDFTDTQKQKEYRTGNTIKDVLKNLENGLKNIFIGINGNVKRGQYLKSIISIIRMVISIIMTFPILSVYLGINIWQIITKLCRKRLKIKKLAIWKHMQDQKHQNGINQKRVENGTENMQKKQYMAHQENLNVLNVAKRFLLRLSWKLNFAQGDVKTDMELGETEQVENGMLIKLVLFAEKLFLLINGISNKHAQENAEQRIEDVYDITVESQHEFFANGVLVHNCSDVFDYIMCHAFNREFLQYQKGGRQTKMISGPRLGV